MFTLFWGTDVPSVLMDSMDLQPRGSTLKVLLNEELLGEFATRSRQREVVQSCRNSNHKNI